MAGKASRNDPLWGTGSSLNLTPLLDVIFLLIFFFILATRIRDRERFLEMELPGSTSAEAREVDDAIPVITITPDGRFLLDGEEVTLQRLGGDLRRAVVEQGAAEAVISSGGDIPWQTIIDVTDVAREAGIERVSPQVRREQGAAVP